MAPRLSAVALFGSVALGSAQSDGNPHQWDRHRRCDHVGYTPKCGPCEGVGGIAKSDTASDITIPSCSVVKTTDPGKRPIWGASFTETRSHEILIGKKQDPACFKAFPSNTSEGTNCYKPQDCVIAVDYKEKNAMRIDANQAGNAWGIFGNVSSVIYHQGLNMWITNKLPLGITQTICTQPKEGGAGSNPIYPVQYNWVDVLAFIATEKVDVEYGVGPRVMDHWGFGPHHAWTDPDTGFIVRMWQPYNGLQIFEPGTFHEGHDPAMFTELTADGKTAPKAAQKGGSTFRIKCADDGFPVTSQEEMQVTSHAHATVSDVHMARRKVPGPAFRGDDFGSMGDALNVHLRKMAPSVRECEEWAVEELQEFQVLMLAMRDPALDGIYQSTTDNRRIRRDVAALRQEWAQLNELARTDPELARMHRDGHCHEAVMWFVHHLPQDARNALKDKVTIPLLSYHRHVEPSDEGHALRIHGAYEEKVTCFSCHSNVLPNGKTQVVV